MNKRLIYEGDTHLIFMLADKETDEDGQLVRIPKDLWVCDETNTLTPSVVLPSTPRRHFTVRDGVVSYLSDDELRPNELGALVPLSTIEVEGLVRLLPADKQKSPLIGGVRGTNG